MKQRDRDLVSASGLFDNDWYLAAYPDVAALAVEPIEHFLMLGWLLGRNPSPAFDTKWYLATNPDVATSGINPLVHYLQHGCQEGRLPRPNGVLALEGKLWGGFSEAARAALEALYMAGSVGAQERSLAALALAQWYVFQKDWRQAWQVLSGLNEAEYQALPQPSGWLLECECLIELGQADKAVRRLDGLLDVRAGDKNLLLAAANAWLAGSAAELDGDLESRRLGCINRVFEAAGLAPLSKLDAQKPLSLDNITAAAEEPRLAVTVPKVSVIMPVFNAQDTVGTALRSLLAQTWRNLEVLVVDDCSTDASFERILAIARADERVVPLRHERNQGAYAARNTALSQATGDYITVHDSDDWSHPQKLALQVEALLQDSSLAATATHWVRSTPELYFGRWRVEDGWIYRNVSSLMFRRSVFQALGYWDAVSVNADTEYYHRIQRRFGAAAVAEVLTGTPLAFGRIDERSLSQASTTHLRTQFYGLRREYHEAAQHWHASAISEQDLYLPQTPAKRPFPAPAVMTREAAPSRIDWLLVGDLSPGNPDLHESVCLLERQLQDGGRVAVFHWADFYQTELQPVAGEVRQLQAQYGFPVLLPADEICASRGVLLDPALLYRRPDVVPTMTVGRLECPLVVLDAAARAAILVSWPGRLGQVLDYTDGACATK